MNSTWTSAPSTVTPTMLATPSCNPAWVQQYFYECVHNDVQLIGFFLGVLANGFSLVAHAPQLYKNFKKKDASGLSITFVSLWLIGDISNLLGCMLADRVQTQYYTACYYVIIDSVMMLQYIIYSRRQKRMTKQALVINAVLVAAGLVMGRSHVDALQQSDGSVHHGRKLLMLHFETSKEDLIGYSLAWVSGLLYFFSRIPQIVMNYQRKSCGGVAIGMFILALMVNVCYTCGILLEGHSEDFVIDHFPWLLGSLGTMPFDFFILYQSRIYKDNEGPTIYESQAKSKDELESATRSEKKPLISGVDEGIYM